MHLAHFVQRFPPALGGSEAYFARLGEYLAGCGDTVDVWTTTAIDLEAFWNRGKALPPSPPGGEGMGVRGPRHQMPNGRLVSDTDRSTALPVTPNPSPPRGEGNKIRRFSPIRFPARRYVLKAASLLPFPAWQALTLPCNPICPGMWRAATRYDGPLDAVHATAFPYAYPILCGLRLARRRRVPFLLTPFLHLGDPTNPRDRTRKQYTSRPLRWLLRQADRVFVQTAGERDMAVSLGVSERRVVLQGLGVDPAECTGGDRESVRKRWGVSPGEVVVGHLANNSVEKGTVDLLRAAERVWAAGGECRVVLAGPEMTNFRTFWQTFGRKGRVTRLGVLSDGEKRDFFAGIDLFALPSRSDSFGLVLLEAWANGKPVVVYRAGGPADLVRDGVDGRVVPCGDVAELCEAIRGMVDRREVRAAMGRAGRGRAEEEFRWEDKLKLVRDVLGDAVREYRRGVEGRVMDWKMERSAGGGPALRSEDSASRLRGG